MKKPMLFSEAEITDVELYINDQEVWFQQKVDGIRAQLVVDSEGIRFIGRNGQPLKSTTAAKTVKVILPHIQSVLSETPPVDSPAYVVDGEILDGVWHTFDYVDLNEPLSDLFYIWRKPFLKAWVQKIDHPQIKELHTAYSPAQKRDLWERVLSTGGEGVIARGSLTRYDWTGKRSVSSVKLKITSTIDVVVIEKHIPAEKNNAVIGFWINDGVHRIGTVSLIGKEKEYTIDIGDVVEIEYLHADPADFSVVQPRIVGKREDKSPEECLPEQLRFVNKEVLRKR